MPPKKKMMRILTGRKFIQSHISRIVVRNYGEINQPNVDRRWLEVSCFFLNLKKNTIINCISKLQNFLSLKN